MSHFVSPWGIKTNNAAYFFLSKRDTVFNLLPPNARLTTHQNIQWYNPFTQYLSGDSGEEGGSRETLLLKRRQHHLLRDSAGNDCYT
jgi:hypothetical protein